MNRNIQRQIAEERGVDIRMPSTALLGVSSSDRYPNMMTKALNGTSPYDVLLTSAQNFLNGFFTRIALTEVRIPWYLPTITDRNNTITLQYFAGPAPPVSYIITLTNGWYTPTTLAAELQAAVRRPIVNGGANLPSFTCTYSGATFSFSAASNVVGDEFIFLPNATANTSSQLFNMMNWRNNYVATTQISGVPSLLSTEYIDVVSSQLTYAQDVKDGDTGKVTRDVVARIYLAKDGVDTTPELLGSTPFILYRQFQTPKQIKWNSNLPIGQMEFQLYDDKGNALTTGVAQTANLEALDNAMGDWSITLLVSEV